MELPGAFSDEDPKAIGFRDMYMMSTENHMESAAAFCVDARDMHQFGLYPAILARILQSSPVFCRPDHEDACMTPGLRCSWSAPRHSIVRSIVRGPSRTGPGKDRSKPV